MPKNNKKYNKLTQKKLKATFTNWHAANTGKSELEQLSESHLEQAAELAAYLQSKPLYLQFSPVELIAAIFILAGCQDAPQSWQESGDPQQSALEFIDSEEFDSAFEAADFESQQQAVAMAMAVAVTWSPSKFFLSP